MNVKWQQALAGFSLTSSHAAHASRILLASAVHMSHVGLSEAFGHVRIAGRQPRFPNAPLSSRGQPTTKVVDDVPRRCSAVALALLMPYNPLDARQTCHVNFDDDRNVKFFFLAQRYCRGG